MVALTWKKQISKTQPSWLFIHQSYDHALNLNEMRRKETVKRMKEKKVGGKCHLRGSAAKRLKTLDPHTMRDETSSGGARITLDKKISLNWSEMFSCLQPRPRYQNANTRLWRNEITKSRWVNLMSLWCNIVLSFVLVSKTRTRVPATNFHSSLAPQVCRWQTLDTTIRIVQYSFETNRCRMTLHYRN